MKNISLYVSVISLVQSFTIHKQWRSNSRLGNTILSKAIESELNDNESLESRRIQQSAMDSNDVIEFKAFPKNHNIDRLNKYGNTLENDPYVRYLIQFWCLLTNLRQNTFAIKKQKNAVEPKMPNTFEKIEEKETWNLKTKRFRVLITQSEAVKGQHTLRKVEYLFDYGVRGHLESIMNPGEKNGTTISWLDICDCESQISVNIQMREKLEKILDTVRMPSFSGLNNLISQPAFSYSVPYVSTYEAVIMNIQNNFPQLDDKMHVHTFEPYCIDQALYSNRFFNRFPSVTLWQDNTQEKRVRFLPPLSTGQIKSTPLLPPSDKVVETAKQSGIYDSSVQKDDRNLNSCTRFGMVQAMKKAFWVLFLGSKSEPRCMNDIELPDTSRRNMLISAHVALGIQPAYAAKTPSFRPSGSRKPISPTPKMIEPSQSNSIERCILQLLPLKNTVFRMLESYVLELSTLRSEMDVESYAMKNAQNRLEYAIGYLDKNRRSLEPVFNEEDSAIFQIEKAERGERLIEAFRSELSVLLAYSKVQKVEELLARQKKALLALSEVGELMVGKFPYLIPKEGKFSFLPRLEGRCKVTFTFMRGNDHLGTCTILADGYAAPITAGNFIDLSLRGFYSGLPVKVVRKRFGESRTPKSNFFVEFAESSLDSFRYDSDQDGSSGSSPVQILGSYKEGFYDPLTAKVRRIPLELLKQEKISGNWQLSYEQGFTKQMNTFNAIDQETKPFLTFETIGLIAFHHGEKIQGSSEFFFLRDDVMNGEERKLLDGQYTAFGYIIDGYNMLKSLKAGDIISETSVDDFGQQNLVKIRGTSFSDVLQKGSVIE
jgi:peptidylprolyl isomerase